MEKYIATFPDKDQGSLRGNLKDYYVEVECQTLDQAEIILSAFFTKVERIVHEKKFKRGNKKCYRRYKLEESSPIWQKN